MEYHDPIMLKEVLESLKVTREGKYIDCTLGDGGHTLEILKAGGTVLGLDVSDSSLERAKKRIQELGWQKNFKPVRGNFKNLENIAKENDFDQVNGILFDLGYTLNQLGVGLGLSFLADEPLDMRLDRNLDVTAADLVNGLSGKELARLIKNYSDERYARKFAKAIVKHRNLKKIQTTKDLSDLLVDVAPPGYENGRIHAATRTFQALRIAVNDELENLKISLPQAARLLLPGGRMIVLTFHSLEDKLVKEFGRGVQPRLGMVTKKPLVPESVEISKNISARSAKMRVFEKL